MSLNSPYRLTNSSWTSTCMGVCQTSYYLTVDRIDTVINTVMKSLYPDIQTTNVKWMMWLANDQRNVTEKLQRIWTWKTKTMCTQTLRLWVLSQMYCFDYKKKYKKKFIILNNNNNKKKSLIFNRSWIPSILAT